ncbi:hypothetical protein M0804_015008 [Polistes exclamans]|nr:hypothetical protein M0804_015008 [Polistes exclamans]
MMPGKLPGWKVDIYAANNAVKQAKNDADVLIIETAIEKFDATNTTIVVGEDVDLLVLLTARTPMDKIIYFLKPGRAQQRTEIYSSKSLSAYPKSSDIQHLYRVYYQVQTWLDNQLNPEDWGWKLIDNTLEPIKTLLPPAPEKLLNKIFCNCKKGCTAKCGCKKIGLQFTSVYQLPRSVLLKCQVENNRGRFL